MCVALDCITSYKKALFLSTCGHIIPYVLLTCPYYCVQQVLACFGPLWSPHIMGHIGISNVFHVLCHACFIVQHIFNDCTNHAVPCQVDPMTWRSQRLRSVLLYCMHMSLCS